MDSSPQLYNLCDFIEWLIFRSFVLFPQSINEDENLKGKVNFDLKINSLACAFL